MIALHLPLRFLGLCLSIATLCTTSIRAQERPNILFLFADDFTYDAISALGRTDIETPNLDQLARRGTTFTNAYNMGSWSGAVCVASRNMLLTGRSVWRAEKVAGNTQAESDAGRLWPQLLKEVGYDTYMTGKWHLQAKAESAFDRVKHVRPGMPATVEESYNRPLSGKPDTWSSSDTSLGGFWEGGKHWSEVGADDAIGFLSEAKNKPNPFFMYVAFNAPHDPRQAPQDYLDKYPVERMKVPVSYLADYPFSSLIGCGPSLRDEKLAPFPRTEEAVRVHRREYYALISHLDAQIGRIVKALQDSGKADNTWIVFTADHGLAVGKHGLFGKQNMYDHSIRVPFIVVGPKAKAGERNSAAIYLQDVMATSLELAGAKKPESCEFNSFLPLLEARQQSSNYPAVYGAYLALQRCVVYDHWKLIAYPKAGAVRLYNLASDPDELKDLSSDPSQKDRLRRLFKELLELQAQYDDRLDLKAAFPKLSTDVEVSSLNAIPFNFCFVSRRR